MATSAIRVVLADDEVLIREGLASVLERSGFEVVGDSDNAAELLELVREHGPDLAIVDIRMPPSYTSEGLEAARTILERFPDTAVVVLSAHVLVEEATGLLAGGTRTGYLLKRRITDADEFVATLDRILKGGSVVDPALVEELIAARRLNDPLDVLSPRERIFVIQAPAGAAGRAAGPVVSTAKTSLGRILVNSQGRTLYLFQKDKNGKSACTGQCASFWPPLIAAGKPRAGAGTKASLLGTTRRADGRLQVTYSHHPLYTFLKDTKKGQTNGEGVNAFGANWYAVSPAGAKVVSHTAPPGGTNPSISTARGRSEALAAEEMRFLGGRVDGEFAVVCNASAPLS